MLISLICFLNISSFGQLKLFEEIAEDIADQTKPDEFNGEHVEAMPFSIEEADTKVLLYHGTVDKSQTDIGFMLPSDVKLKDFDGYDTVLLGDIHKSQFLNKEETIAYPGSLIQQNFAEAPEHGFLLWDVQRENLNSSEWRMIMDLKLFLLIRVR